MIITFVIDKEKLVNGMIDRFILSNPVSQNDMIIALTLTTDFSSIRNINKNLEAKI